MNKKPIVETQVSKTHEVCETSTYRTGLNIAGILNAPDLPHARNTVEHLMLLKSPKISIPMPTDAGNVVSVFIGHYRRKELAKSLSKANTKTKNEMQIYEGFDSREDIDWSSAAGFNYLLPIINKHKSGWVTIEQSIGGTVTASMADGFARIDNAAKSAGIRIMLFVVCADGYQKSNLNRYSEDYLEISSCDADSNYQSAFLIDCLGVGKTMCNLKLVDGEIKYRFSPFVSSSLEARVIWYMRGQGLTLEEIGQKMDINKTTVLRRLQGLPPPKKSKSGQQLIANYFDPYLETDKTDAEQEDSGGQSSKRR